ncbi:hypothetical protein PAV_1c09110 [Paenibacillus alvei DSM 29]|nr:hypothetical protein PAV_1c09110 [Paenibacillus alvei DSM 29]
MREVPQGLNCSNHNSKMLTMHCLSWRSGITTVFVHGSRIVLPNLQQFGDVQQASDNAYRRGSDAARTIRYCR